jgi:hypothetical protein
MVANGIAYSVSLENTSLGTVTRASGGCLAIDRSPIGQRCYEVFFGRRSACPSCPVFSPGIESGNTKVAVVARARGGASWLRQCANRRVCPAERLMCSVCFCSAGRTRRCAGTWHCLANREIPSAKAPQEGRC